MATSLLPRYSARSLDSVPPPPYAQYLMGVSTHKKVLIVEDEQDILQLVKHYLEKEGFRPITAISGLDALKKVKEEKPDPQW